MGSVPDVDGVVPSGCLYPPNPLPRTSLGGSSPQSDLPLLYGECLYWMGCLSLRYVFPPWDAPPVGGMKDSLDPVETLDAGVVPPL